MTTNRYIFTEAGEQLFKDFYNTNLKDTLTDSDSTKAFKSGFRKAIRLLLELNTSEFIKSLKQILNNHPDGAIKTTRLATLYVTNTNTIKNVDTINKKLNPSQDSPLSVTPRDAEQVAIAQIYHTTVLCKLLNKTNLTGTANRPFTNKVVEMLTDAISTQYDHIQQSAPKKDARAKIEAQEEHDKIVGELKAVAKIEFTFSDEDTAITVFQQIMNKAAPFELLQQNDDYSEFNCSYAQLCDKNNLPKDYFEELKALVDTQMTTCEAVQPPNNANTALKSLLSALQKGINTLNHSVESNNASGKTTPADDFSERSISSAHSSAMFSTERSKSNSSDATQDSVATPPPGRQETTPT
jgi:hypothetical protein